MTDYEQKIPAAVGVTIEQQVRWGDMDALGHLNNTVYFRFCESARISYFDTLDLDRFKRKPTDGPAIVTAQLNFRRQMHYPGTVCVTANVKKLSGRSFVLSYVLRDTANDETIADGDSVCVWVDYAAEKALPIPDEMAVAIAELEQNCELHPQPKT